MRSVLVFSLAAGFLVAGCGSSGSSPAPVESGAPAEVAAAAACPEGAPARSPMNIAKDDILDGVVGSIYNRTGGTIFVAFTDGSYSEPDSDDAGCALADGKSVAVAASSYYILARGIGTQTGKTLISANDQTSWWPTVTASTYYVRSPKKVCDGAGSDGLSEGQDWWVDTADIGKVRAVRLEDNADAVHTWTGFDTWAVRDWARIDFEIYRLGEGC